MGPLTLRGSLGQSVDRQVLLGFAPAGVLHAVSFADVLDERTGQGYQRRFNAQHSLDFRRYIARPGAATIPLTFNLRPPAGAGWGLEETGAGTVALAVQPGCRPLAQVDCQHRLGFLGDSDVILPFMCFLGLSTREEMEVFGVINGKARGLSRSILDFQAAQLCGDLASERPELLVALQLKNEPSSPWYNRLDLGGDATSGLERRASLRTMQKAAKIYLRRLRPGQLASVEEAAAAAHAFWVAVADLVPEVFIQSRRYLVTKGIGVYALMELAADVVNEQPPGRCPDPAAFTLALADFVPVFDWSNSGPLKGLGGEGGAAAAARIIREARRRANLKVAHG